MSAAWIKGTGEGTNLCCGCGSRTGPCSNPPLPVLHCDSISASKTKCGFDTYVVTTPPKKYLVMTLSGSITSTTYSLDGCSGDCVAKTIWTASGSCTYSESTCALTSAASTKKDSYQPCDTLQNSVTTAHCGIVYDGAGDATTLTETTSTLSGTGCTGSAGTVGSMVETLSSEYTTANLISDTVAALPSTYPGTFTGTCGSLYNLSVDELTFTVRRFKYKFTLPTLTGYTCYKLTWTEGATPKSYTWDGSATETPVYGPVMEPGSNGSVVISGITATCACV